MASDPLAAAAQLAQSGRLDEAAQLCERVLATQPMHGPALGLAGVIALHRGDAVGALRRLSLAVTVEPRNPGHQLNLGEALSANGRFADAIEAYRRALKLDARNARAQSGLAFALQAQGDAMGALNAFSRAADLDRKAPDIQINFGAALQQAGRNDEAVAVLRRALSLAPNAAEAHFNLGAALAASGELDSAKQAYEAALRLAPAHVKALNNLGRVLEEKNDREGALRHYTEAADVAPDFPEAWYNRANMLKELGRYREAMAAFDRALLLKPDYPDALKNRGLVCLTLGAFVAGWRDYRARAVPRPSGDAPAEPLPADLSEQRILVLREQGVGDELFFLRFAPRLVARGAQVSAVVDPRLAGMIARSGTFAQVFEPGEETGTFDRRLFMADLPFLLGHIRPEDCPRALPLVPADSSVARLRARLEAAGPAPWIAVSWRAGVPGNLRSVPPALLGRALAGKRGTVVLVQRNPAAEDVAAFAAALGRPAVDLAEINDDLEDMLALMALADVYVAVSNTNVHLRASVGRPTHVLVPHPPEWRWLAEGRSPWFPDCPVYRQTAAYGWADALGQLGRDLG
jgi:tetratricopeptide (TPR) repeat protein